MKIKTDKMLAFVLSLTLVPLAHAQSGNSGGMADLESQILGKQAQQAQEAQDAKARAQAPASSRRPTVNQPTYNPPLASGATLPSLPAGYQAENDPSRAMPASAVPPGAIVYVENKNGELVPRDQYLAQQAQAQSQAADGSLQPPALQGPQMQPMTPKRSMASPMALERRALDNVSHQYYGMTPEDIKRFRKETDSRSRAAAQMPALPPKPVTRTVNISLAPGTSPEVIRASVNQSTSLVVTDSTGAPWPVVNFSIGNSKAFDVKRLDDASGEGCLFSITPLGNYSYSNMVLALKGSHTPVVLTLVSGQKEVDYRASLRIMSMGPNAKVSMSQVGVGADTSLLTVLDGVPPEGGKMLMVTGPHAENTSAWLVGGKMVVRTDLKVLSPASPEMVQSPDGTTVYQFMPTNTLLAMKNGAFLNIRIVGW